MIEIAYLADYPKHTHTVAEWIYNQWTDKSKKTLEEVTENLKKRRVKNKIPLTLIALADKVCVGTVTIYENDLETRKDLTPWLGSLWVAPSHRNLGIGAELVKKTVDVTKQLGFNKLYLRTEEKADYYSKRGWDFIFNTRDEKGIETEVLVYQL
ncbi:MAG: GNAT family N-acetyltransferase [Candidatus Buchananbacteria bacterium]